MAALTIIRGLRRCESGAEFVEMALAFPLLLMVVLGIFDFGLLFQQYEVVTNAAREGARLAVLPGYTATDARNRALQYTSSGLLTGGGTPTVTVGAPVNVVIGSGCMTTVTVTVSYPHPFPFVGGIASYFGGSALGTATLRGQSTMRREIAASPCP